MAHADLWLQADIGPVRCRVMLISLPTLFSLAGVLVMSKFSLLDFYSLCPNHRSHELIYLVILLASGAQMVIGVYLSREVCEVECAQNLGMFLFHYVGFILGEFIKKVDNDASFSADNNTYAEPALHSQRAETHHPILLRWWWCWRWGWQWLRQFNTII